MAIRIAPRPVDSPNPSSVPPIDEAASTCRNCGAALNGAYCAACGQAADTRRLTVPHLARSALGGLLNLDSSIIRTLRALTTRPGRFIRDYLLGQRVGYVGPLHYYVVVVALNVGAAALLRRPAVSPVSIETGGSFWDENLVALQISAVFALLMLPLAAAQRWLLYRRAGYSFAEHYAFTLYTLAQSVLAVLVLQLVLWIAGSNLEGDLEGAAWALAFTAQLVWAGHGFFSEPLWRVVLKLLGAYAAVLACLSVIGVILRAIFGGA